MLSFNPLVVEFNISPFLAPEALTTRALLVTIGSKCGSNGVHVETPACDPIRTTEV